MLSYDEIPEGFGPEDEVAFDQLPYQIQDHYIGPPSPLERHWLKGTKAVLTFWPQPPHLPQAHYWERTPIGILDGFLGSGEWTLIRTDRKTDQPAVNSHQREGEMDTKKLVVGQEVHLRSGIYNTKGKVVKVTPDGGVEVRIPISYAWNARELMHFDNYGKGRDDEGTWEEGPWELVDDHWNEA
jgi:hypothetical protein